MRSTKAVHAYGATWPVNATGYEWIESRLVVGQGHTVRKPYQLTTEPLLVLVEKSGESHRPRVYSPLDNPVLYRVFAKLPAGDKEAIAAFAGDYGFLGIRRALETFARWGESLEDWSSEIVTMERAVSMWDMVDRNDVEGLSPYIVWQHDDIAPQFAEVLSGCYYRPRPDLPANTPLPLPVPYLQPIGQGPVPFQRGEIVGPASLCVERMINFKLRGNVAPVLGYSGDIRRPILQHVPDDLLSAMWLQFAQAIASGKKVHICAASDCGKPFEISRESDGRTKRRIYCSDACKTRDFRRRKAEAPAKPAKKRKR